MTDVWELVNPSDFCTLEGPRVSCGIAALLLGTGQCPLVSTSTGDTVVPLLRLWAEDEQVAWIEDFCGGPINQYIREHASDVADALRSLVYGDRHGWEVAVAVRTDREAFRLAWNEQRRSSLNNMSERSHAIAERVLVLANGGAP